MLALVVSGASKCSSEWLWNEESPSAACHQVRGSVLDGDPAGSIWKHLVLLFPGLLFVLPGMLGFGLLNWFMSGLSSET